MKSTKAVFRGFFESKLAELVLNNKDTVPAVVDISQAILKLIVQNKENLLETIQLDLISESKIANDLYGESFFGRLSVVRKETPEEILEDIMAVLLEGEDLAQVMHIHSLFVYRLFKSIEITKLAIEDREGSLSKSARYSYQFQQEPKEAIALVNAMTSHRLKVIADRGRVKSKDQVIAYDKIGYQLPTFFASQLAICPNHISGGCVFERSTKSYYANLVNQTDSLFVAGTSGHTLNFIKGMLLYGNLDIEQQKQYALAIFAYLAGGGNHSFGEVMVVMHVIVDLEYQANEYLPSLPKSLLQSDAYCEGSYSFSRRYSQFLDDNYVNDYVQKKWHGFFAEVKSDAAKKMKESSPSTPSVITN